MSSRGFTSAFAAELEAYLAFKASMGFYGTSRIWYLRRFDAYCSEHNRTVSDRDTVEEWVGVQLQHSGRYRSWMSYIRDFGRWLSMHGATDAYVLSESWKAPILAPHPYLLAAREIELFFSAAAQLQVQSPWRWQAAAFFTLMHSCGLRTGETRALQPGQVDLDGGHIDIVWSKGHRSRRLPLTDQVVEILTACDRTSRTHFTSRHTFSSPPPVTRSPPPPSGKCSAASGIRPHYPGPWPASSHDHTTSGTTSPTPTSTDG